MEQGQRFARQSRLTDACEFGRVFEQAVRCSDRAFTILARRSPCAHARLGLAISKKCTKRAVARNRIKRLVRESFRAAQHDLPAVDLVVMCRPVINDMTHAERTAALQKLWQCVRNRCRQS
ncbi:MAG: ribonuclease P protein component [Gammaproteobacteria bacterium]|nr:ribonuclease P protein component [Gammaproteobacteria bacterium]